MKNRLAVGLVMVLVVVAGWSCDGSAWFGQKEGTVVARVNKGRLTVEQLAQALPQSGEEGITAEQKAAWVNTWIERELLYQEAIKQGILDRPEVRWATDRMVRDLVVAAYLQEALAIDTSAVTEEQIEVYYETHQEAFIRHQDQAYVHMILVEDKAEANRMFWRLRRNPQEFAELAREKSSDPTARQGGEVGYVTPLDIARPNLRQMVFALKPQQISSPVKTEEGYCILKVSDLQKAGTVKPLELVRDEIVQALLEEQKRKQLALLLDKLKERAEIELYPEQVP